MHRSRRDLLCHCKKAFTDGAAELVDALDQRHDLLPMRNGVVELDTGVFRRARWDDYVRETTGYDYVPEAEMPPDHVEWVERFYEMLFPKPDERCIASCSSASPRTRSAGPCPASGSPC